MDATRRAELLNGSDLGRSIVRDEQSKKQGAIARLEKRSASIDAAARLERLRTMVKAHTLHPAQKRMEEASQVHSDAQTDAFHLQKEREFKAHLAQTTKKEMKPERRREILSQSEIGRVILREEAAKKR